MSDYEAIRSRESVTSVARALNALRSWVLSKSRRPKKEDLDEIILALRSGPTDYRKSLSPSDETDLPPTSRVFEALLIALDTVLGKSGAGAKPALEAWTKFTGEISESHKEQSKTSLSLDEAGTIIQVLETWLHALLQRSTKAISSEADEHVSASFKH